MRKLSIIAVLVLGMSIAALSQNVFRIKAASVGKWSTYSESFMWSKKEAADLRIIFQSNVILIDNKEQTALRLGKQVLDKTDTETNQKAWMAVDQDDVTCTVRVLKDLATGKREVCIIYTNYAFNYYLD